MTTQWVNAEEVKVGDFLPGLSNGYVFEDPEPASDSLSFFSGFTPVRPDESLVLISFHDEQGDENYLILRSDFQVQVNR